MTQVPVSANDSGAQAAPSPCAACGNAVRKAAGAQPDAIGAIPLDLLPDATVVADAAGRIVTVNRQFEGMFGHSAASVIGRPVEVLMPPQLRGRHSVEARRYRAEPLVRTMGSGRDLLALRADGTEFPVAIALAPMGSMTVASIRDISDRVAAAQSLRDSEQRYRELVENAPDMVYQLDGRLRFTYLSEGILRLLGYERAELMGQPIERVLTEAAATIVEGVVAERTALEQRGVRTDIKSYEIDCLRKDGAVVPVEIRSRPVRDANGGGIEGYLCVARDIEERRRAEEILRQSRAHLALAQSVGRIGSVQIDLATGYDYWSDEMYRLLGLDPAATRLTAEAVLSLTHPDDTAVLRELHQLARRGIEAEPIEVRVNRPDGGVRWLLRTPMVLRDEVGTPRTHFVTYQDVTERKLAEAALRDGAEELRRSRERLLDSQEIALLGSWEFDLVKRKMEWTDEVYRIIGAEPKSFAASYQAFLQIVHPEDRDDLDRAYGSAVTGSGTHDFVHRIVRLSDGEIRWCHERCKYERDTAGRPIRLMGTVQDITDRKRSEEERSALQYQLYQSQKLDALGRLAGGVAHDFNNLLAVILGHLEMAGEELADRPEIRDWVLAAARAARRGASLTKMMLAYARAQPLQTEVIVPSAIALEMAGMLERLLGGTIAVKVTTAPEQWHCEADPGLLQNALLNLAVNARDAMPKAGTLIVDVANVRLDASDAARIAGAGPGDYVAVSVKDTGSGMPPDVAAWAFEPFFTTKGVGKGTGLGLSMVDGFARQLGGFVTLVSEMGCGTTVSIYLPRKMVGQGSIPAAAGREAPRRGTETILVVEDNDELRNLIVHQIRALDYQVVTAASAIEGMAALRAHPEVALLLSDIALPGGVDGVEAVRSAVDARPDLKIVFMTGHTDHSELPLLGRSTPPRLLRKPFASRDLAAAIRDALDED